MIVHNSRMKKLPGPISDIVRPLVPAQVEYRVSRNSSFDMEQPQLSHSQYSHHPPPRLVLAWNRLPENVKASPMQNFRTTLSDYYLSLYSRQCDQIDCAACTHMTEFQGWISFPKYITLFLNGSLFSFSVFTQGWNSFPKNITLFLNGSLFSLSVFTPGMWSKVSSPVSCQWPH